MIKRVYFYNAKRDEDDLEAWGTKTVRSWFPDAIRATREVNEGLKRDHGPGVAIRYFARIQ